MLKRLGDLGGTLGLAPGSNSSNTTSGEPFSIAFTDSGTDIANAIGYTFSAKSFGAASASRRVVVVACARAAGTTLDIASITIGGIAGTQVGASARNITSGVNITVMFIADVPSGATGDVVVTWNETTLRCGIAVYAMKGAGSAVASATGTSTAAAPTATLTIPAGGGAIAGAMTAAGAATSTPTNLTEDLDIPIETLIAFTAGSNTSSSGSTAMTFTFTTPVDSAGIFATWGP